MYKYKVEMVDESGKPSEYVCVTADGYCAELEARKKFPNNKIGEVKRIGDCIRNNPNA